MKEKIIEIIGFNMEPERATLIAEQLLDLFGAMEGLPSQNDVVNDAENKHGVMQAEASASAEGADVGKERRTQSKCDGIKHSPFSIKGLDGIIRCADCGTQLYPSGTPVRGLCDYDIANCA